MARHNKPRDLTHPPTHQDVPVNPDLPPDDDGPLAPDEWARIQSESDDLEGEPKPVALIPGDNPDEDFPPSSPTARSAPAPRFVHQNERAPEGLTRYKIRCVNLIDQPSRYVLAESEDAARDHYIRATGIQSLLDALPEASRPEPRLSVRRQPD